MSALINDLNSHASGRSTYNKVHKINFYKFLLFMQAANKPATQKKKAPPPKEVEEESSEEDSSDEEEVLKIYLRFLSISL